MKSRTKLVRVKQRSMKFVLVPNFDLHSICLFQLEMSHVVDYSCFECPFLCVYHFFLAYILCSWASYVNVY